MDGLNHASRDQLIDAEFVAETNLPTDLGHFRLRAYRVARTANEFMGTEPTVIYCTDKPPFGREGKLAENVPVRVHDQCLTSEVFRSQRYVLGRDVCAAQVLCSRVADCAAVTSS